MKKLCIAITLAALATGAFAQTAQNLPTKPETPAQPPSVAKSMNKLKPDEQKKFQESVKTTGVSASSIQNMDLEAAMMMVQSKRAELLETQLKEQLSGVQKRNELIAKLNQAIAQLNKAAAGFPSDAKPTTKIDTTNFKANDYQLEKEINAALEAAAVKPFAAAGGDATSARGRTTKNTIYEGGIGSGTTKAQLDAAIQQLKANIDSMNNSQQMDMLRLQSLSNKRNEAFDVMTNFIKKMQDNRSSVIGNMR